jgi:ParB family transcriptional regulator, chromosome partitioning protein
MAQVSKTFAVLTDGRVVVAKSTAKNEENLKKEPTEAPIIDIPTKMDLPIGIIDPPKILIRDLDQQTISNLAASIKKHGVIQAISVRQKPDGRYEIILGNHRFQAAKKAGLKIIPVSIKNVDDNKALLLSLVENIQRLDMNPYKEGQIFNTIVNGNTGIKALMALSEEISKSIPYIQQRIHIFKNLNPTLSPELGRTLTLTSAEMLCRQPKEIQQAIFVKIQQAKIQVKASVAKSPTIDQKINMNDIDAALKNTQAEVTKKLKEYDGKITALKNRLLEYYPVNIVTDFLTHVGLISDNQAIKSIKQIIDLEWKNDSPEQKQRKIKQATVDLQC